MSNVHFGNSKDDSDCANGVKTLLIEVLQGGNLANLGGFPYGVVKIYFQKRFSNIFKTSIKDVKTKRPKDIDTLTV